MRDDQFPLLDDNMDKNSIKYDQMYIQSTPILLFRHANKNCYVNIIEHAKAEVITSTCTFLYYQYITVHATLVTTGDFFFFLSIQDEMRVTCGLFNHETVRSAYSVSIINRKNLCNCLIQTSEIQLIGSHANCSSKRNILIRHTFNFVTEWIRNKKTMSYYRENVDISHLPGQAKLPDLSVLKSNTDNVYTESKTPAISLHKLDALVNILQNQDLHLIKADKNRKDNKLFNETNNMDDTDSILDINS